MVLHFKNVRQLRPWEQEHDEEDDTHQDNTIPKLSTDSRERTPSPGGHSRKNNSVSSTASSRLDPLRKESLQTFGPRNDYTREDSWRVAYRKKGVLDKMFDETVPVQNRALRMLQDRTVFFAVLWGGVGASVLTVGSLFIPARNLIL